MPDKLTDNEIVKALKDFINHNGHCVDCPSQMKNALDLISRLQAEKSNLKIELKAMRVAANSYKKMYEDIQHLEMKVDKIKAEAYKEFAERLETQKLSTEDIQCRVWSEYVEVSRIKNLLKELVGKISKIV